jgi:hypothetical protein
LYLLQLAGLLDSAQRTDHGVKEKRQHQQAVLIEVEFAVARPVTLTANLVQTFEQRQEFVEVLQSRNIPLANLFTPLARHGTILSEWQQKSTATPWRKFRAEQDWDCPLFLHCPAGSASIT